MKTRMKYGAEGPLTQAELKRQLNYDPEIGVFTWAIRKPKVQMDAVAGKVKANGYGEVRINLVSYGTHRLAWLYVHGEWPDGIVDHINRDPTDNRINNLRVVTYSQNYRNVGPRKNSKTGVKGVCMHNLSGKYRATIRIEGRRLYLGLFETAEAAKAAYEKAAIEHHGGFAYPK
jgi:hypothetical protein